MRLWEGEGERGGAEREDERGVRRGAGDERWRRGCRRGEERMQERRGGGAEKDERY